MVPNLMDFLKFNEIKLFQVTDNWKGLRANRSIES